jgi:hypothetical protein
MCNVELVEYGEFVELGQLVEFIERQGSSELRGTQPDEASRRLDAHSRAKPSGLWRHFQLGAREFESACRSPDRGVGMSIVGAATVHPTPHIERVLQGAPKTKNPAASVALPGSMIGAFGLRPSG